MCSLGRNNIIIVTAFDAKQARSSGAHRDKGDPHVLPHCRISGLIADERKGLIGKSRAQN